MFRGASDRFGKIESVGTPAPSPRLRLLPAATDLRPLRPRYQPRGYPSGFFVLAFLRDDQMGKSLMTTNAASAVTAWPACGSWT